MSDLALGLSIAAIIMAFISMVLTMINLSYAVGLKNSTHQIQYVPLNEGLGDKEVKQEFEDTFNTSFDDDDNVHV